MPRKRKTAIKRLVGKASAREKFRVMLYGDQEKNPVYDLALLLRTFAVENHKDGVINTGDDALLLGSKEATEGMKQSLFNLAVNAVAERKPAFFLQMAAAVEFGYTYWRDDGDNAPADQTAFDVLEAVKALNEKGGVVRPGDVVRMLEGKYSADTIERRLRSLGIKLHSKPGRPGGSRNNLR